MKLLSSSSKAARNVARQVKSSDFLLRTSVIAAFSSILVCSSAFAVTTYTPPQNNSGSNSRQDGSGFNVGNANMSGPKMAPGFQSAAPGFSNGGNSNAGGTSTTSDYVSNRSKEANADEGAASAVDESARNDTMTNIMNQMGDSAPAATESSSAVKRARRHSKYNQPPEPVMPDAESDAKNGGKTAPPSLEAMLAGLNSPANAALDGAENTEEKVKPKKRMPTFNYKRQNLPPSLYKESYTERDNSKLPTRLTWKKLNDAMFAAAARGDLNTMRALKQKGVDMRVRNASGESLLLAAARANKTNAVHWLVLNGAYVNEMNNRGESALVIATRNGNVKMTKTLMDAGARSNSFAGKSLDPAPFAQSKGGEMQKLYQRYGAL